MKTHTKTEKIALAFTFVMFVLLAAACVIALYSFGSLKKANKKLSDCRSDAEVKLSELEKTKNTSLRSLTELENELALAEKSRDELQAAADEAERKLSELTSGILAGDELYNSLTERLTSVSAELEAKNSEIEALLKDIAAYGKIYSVDLNEQSAIIGEIETLLSEGASMNKVQTPKYDAEGRPLLDGDGKNLFEDSYVYPKISVYYEDIGRGYTYTWNADTVYSSAGCIMAPYALSLLEAASEEKAAIDSKINEYITKNGAGAELPAFEKKYDFTTVFSYNEKSYKAGSGIIKDKEYGTEYTQLELIDIMLKYSDNVAYGELKDKYGNSLIKKLVKSLGTDAMKDSITTATARDMGLVMKSIYSFTESGTEYSGLMKESMMSSIHTVMIGMGVSPKKIIHKYGWDTGAYHDAAIVCGDHPYILVIMTDMEAGGNTVNKYIQKVAGLIDDLHDNFYH